MTLTWLPQSESWLCCLVLGFIYFSAISSHLYSWHMKRCYSSDPQFCSWRSPDSSYTADPAKQVKQVYWVRWGLYEGRSPGNRLMIIMVQYMNLEVRGYVWWGGLIHPIVHVWCKFYWDASKSCKILHAYPAYYILCFVLGFLGVFFPLYFLTPVCSPCLQLSHHLSGWTVQQLLGPHAPLPWCPA